MNKNKPQAIKKHLVDQTLILGSSSIYRKELLQRLGLNFTTDSPDIDETRKNGEKPDELVKRLSYEKAKVISERHSQSLIIGSDQVAVNGDQILGKPGNKQTAMEQLRQASGRSVTFLTGLCLLNADTNQFQIDVVQYAVYFRELRSDQISAYLDTEQPYNCAGSFKSEGLGVALFEKMEGEDPTALVGLPLIRLVDMLRKEGVEVLS
ncbi:MAG: nucleoside triphosphate pyrophosphatase [Gammaproteobacteria bacterium]